MPRQQKTDSGDTQDAFAALTDKQQAFVVNRAAGMAPRDAYKAAYDAENMSDGAISVEACRLASQPNIALILQSLANEKLETARQSEAERVQDERAFAIRCELSGNMGAAGGARDRINKLEGRYTDRVEDVTQSPVDVLNEIAARDPEIAEILAKRMGLTTEPGDNDTTH